MQQRLKLRWKIIAVIGLTACLISDALAGDLEIDGNLKVTEKLHVVQEAQFDGPVNVNAKNGFSITIPVLPYHQHDNIIMRTGRVGSDVALPGTTGKWIKLGEFNISGPWREAGADWEVYPANHAHGNRRQRISIHGRNNLSTGVEGIKVSLLHLDSGFSPTFSDVKAIHKSGSGVTDNVIAVWARLARSWLAGQNPVVVHHYGNWTELILEPSQIYDAIPDTGTEYAINTFFGSNKVGGNWIVSNRIGIGTDTPAAPLHVAGDAQFDGAVTINGETVLTESGNNAIVSSITVPSTVGGYSLILGQGSRTDANYSMAVGQYNVAHATASAVIGHNNGALSKASIALGGGNQARGYGQLSVGLYNSYGSSIPYQSITDATLVPDDQIMFMVGNGTSDTDRSNAFTVTKAGDTWMAGDLLMDGGIRVPDLPRNSAVKTVLHKLGRIGSLVHESATTDKWIKLGQFTLDGAYASAGAEWEIHPGYPADGNRRQRISVNSWQSTISIGGVNVSLVNLDSGQRPLVKDVKVVHTSGTGVAGNVMSIWAQLAGPWLTGVNSVAVNYNEYKSTWDELILEPSPTYTSIPDTGTVYDINTFFGSNKVGGNWLVTDSIGVGTDTPEQKLHVVGNAKVEGTLHVQPAGDIPMFAAP